MLVPREYDFYFEVFDCNDVSLGKFNKLEAAQRLSQAFKGSSIIEIKSKEDDNEYQTSIKLRYNLLEME